MTSKLPSPPAPSLRSVFIRTGEAALADRLANAWAALAQEMEDAP
jgi:hypothetical protein